LFFFTHILIRKFKNLSGGVVRLVFVKDMDGNAKKEVITFQKLEQQLENKIF